MTACERCRQLIIVDTPNSVLVGDDRDDRHILISDVSNSESEDEKFGLGRKIKEYVSIPENFEKLKTCLYLLVVIALFGLVIVGGYYLDYYSTYGKPRYDGKFYIGSSCVPLIDKKISELILKKYEYEHYPPEKWEEVGAVNREIHKLMSFKKEYIAVKDDLFHFDPVLVPMFISFGAYVFLMLTIFLVYRVYFQHGRPANGVILAKLALICTVICFASLVLFFVITAGKCPILTP